MKRLYPILLALILSACTGKITLTNLTVESQGSIMPTTLCPSLATAEPRFSWQYQTDLDSVSQTSYRIIVASTKTNASNGIGDLWDSKQVNSNQMLYIPYQGKTLKSRDHCYWKVFTTVRYGKKGRTKTVESDIHEFEISLLDNSDWQAVWIGRAFDDDLLKGHTAIAARYLRKEFNLKDKINKARLYICGLGVYCAYLNNNEIAPDELLKPTLSDYTKHVYFNTYDVTSMLNQGANAIGVTLEGGRFTAIRYDSTYLEWCGINHTCHYGLPQLLLQLEVTYSDGSKEMIVSDDSWHITNHGPIRKANEFDGETYDARMDLGPWTTAGYDDSDWLPVVAGFDKQNMDFNLDNNPQFKPPYSEQKPVNPTINLAPQPNPNIKVQEYLHPVNIFRKGNKWILDMGKNMVGLLSSKLSDMQPGDTVTFRYAETLNPDSTLYTKNLRSAECTDRYIADDVADNWCPKFTYHGFRYVEITGLRHTPCLNDFTGLVMYDEMETSGSFECSDNVINTIYNNAYWGIRGNYRSMPTDCPQRDERMGWTGDRTTGCYGESYIFNNHKIYAKWLQDIADTQWDNGMLSDVAPAYWRNYTDNMTWPGAFITVADMLFTRFGDFEPVRRHYDGMKRWMLHMKEWYLKDGILTRDTYGDWCVPPESPELIHTKDTNRMTWPGNLSTPYYCHLCKIMQGFASRLDKDDDALFFQKEFDSVSLRYNAHYLDTATGRYDHNTVTANILPLWFGMVPKALEYKVLANIIDKTEREFGGHVSTGVVGIQHLMRTLTEYGRGDLALRLASNDTYPSWGYMVKKGATTIWELWNGDTGDPSMNSGNHVMLLGDLILWEYEYLGGIRPLKQGYSLIELKPYPLDGLDYVNCSYNSVSGRIESNWRRKGNRFEWDILIPANTTAEVWLPSNQGYKRQVLASGHHHLSSQL